MNLVLRHAPNVIAVFMSAVFLDSLRYKFTDHPNTQVIFGRLDDWAESFGAPGLFGHTGLFSQYTIGAAELVASGLLLAGLHPRLRHLQAIGAALGVAIMAGAVNFHLWTPLTIDPNNDGAGLFAAACINLIAGLAIVFWFRRKEAGTVAKRIASVFAPV